MTKDSLCFLEQTDFSLLLARGAAGSSPLRLEALQEVPLADADALAAAVRAVFATESASAICALRPKPRALHLAGADEAKRLPGLGGVRQLATTHSALSDLSPAWLAAVSAREGSAPGAGPWLATLTSAEGQAASTTLLGSLAVKPARSLSATLNSVGAIATTVSAPIWLLEIGELGSSALLISRDGVLAAGPVSLNLDRIAEAVQAELGLKFRGSAIKLFFNPVYDYTDVGPKIAARLAASVKSELAALRGANSAPIALACSGLPAAQHWFSTQLAAALELAAFAPETKSTGLTFATPELEASVSPAWFGFLRLAGTSQTSTPGPWAAEWIKLDTIAPPAAPKPPVSAPIPTPVATPAPVSAPAPAPKPAPAPAAPASAAPKPAAPAPITAASIASKPVAPRPAASATPAPFPLPDAVLSAPRKPVAAATPAVVAPGREPVAPAPVAKPVMAKPTAPTPAPAPAPAPAKAAIAPVAPAPSAAPTPKPAASSSSASDSPKPASPRNPPPRKNWRRRRCPFRSTPCRWRRSRWRARGTKTPSP